MRNHRVVIGNVVKGDVDPVGHGPQREAKRAPLVRTALSVFNNISNNLRYFYEKPPQNNRKCGSTHTGAGTWPQSQEGCPH